MLSEQLESYEMDYIKSDNVPSMYVDYVNEFLNAKIIEGKSKNTIERYEYYLNRIFEEINIPIGKLTIYHIRSYFMAEKNRGISDSTLNGYRSILCSFFGWLQKENLIQNNPVANLGVIKCAKRVREPFSEVEIEKLKSACTNVRDIAIIMFMLSTGCRISEIVELDRDAINFVSLDCKVHGKGNKERLVYIDTVTAMYLKRYFATRDDDEKALFVNRSKERFGVNGIQRMLKTLEKKTGIENVHPHRFRRTLATSLINHGMPIQEVAHILGHEKVDTTMRYIYIESEKVRASYKRFSYTT